MPISKTAQDLILQMEGFRSKPEWPGGQSGVTIGFGYDLDYVTVDQFESDWGERLKADACGGLKAVVGLRALRARSRIGDLSAIRDAVAAGDLAEIAAHLRAMKRLWEGKDLAGLITRREEEAQLVESAMA